MHILTEMEAPPPSDVVVTDETLSVELKDGRTISVPTAWYPRLAHGTKEEREKWTLSSIGIHWECLDEDISIAGLLEGIPSSENPTMIEKWKKTRKNIYEFTPNETDILAVAEEQAEYKTK